MDKVVQVSGVGYRPQGEFSRRRKQTFTGSDFPLAAAAAVARLRLYL